MTDREIRDTLGNFCTGVAVATGITGGKPAGFAVQSFVSLSLDPPLVGLSPAKTSSSWPLLRASGSFCINILTSEQKSICNQFAQRGGNKFDGIAWREGVTRSPVLEDVLAYIDCDLVAEHEVGDHTFAVGQVRDIKMFENARSPLLFFKSDYGVFEPRALS